MISYLKALILTGIIYYVAAIYGSPDLALLCYAVLMLALISLANVLYDRAFTECKLKVPIAMSQQNMRVKVELQVLRKGRPAWGRTVAELQLENLCLACKKTIRPNVKSAGKGVYELVLRDAGTYEITMKKIRIYDRLGLFYLTKKMNGRAQVTVLPDLFPVNIRLTDAVRSYIGDAEIYDSIKSGDDAGEILQLRPFRDGDKLKNIHWKLSAKADELIVKENSLPKACSTVLLLDSRAPLSRNYGRKRTRGDGFIKAAAGISFSMMDKEIPHFVAWYSRSKQDVVRVRVDNEESFYTFLLYMMQDFDRDNKGDLQEMYKDKYHGESLLYYLVLHRDMKLYQKDVLVAELREDDLEKSFSEMELIL
ncbi:MAG: DUF58 domain-containing protein [Lachnospiraceae bacterium]|nr:DUF58 domain-containing protein [Lachnospiraceae bacterium]